MKKKTLKKQTFNCISEALFSKHFVSIFLDSAKAKWIKKICVEHRRSLSINVNGFDRHVFRVDLFRILFSISALFSNTLPQYLFVEYFPNNNNPFTFISTTVNWRSRTLFYIQFLFRFWFLFSVKIYILLLDGVHVKNVLITIKIDELI